jgi:pilus assembly protein CpaE
MRSNNNDGALAVNLETGAPPSLIARNRIVAFANDEISLAALRTGLEDITQQVDFRHGGVRQAIRMLETDTGNDLHAVVVDISGIDDPEAALEDLARVCPPDALVAVLGENTDITFYRLVVHDLGVCEYLSKPLTRDAVQTLLRPKLAGQHDPAIADRGGHVVTICGAQGGAGATTIAVNLALQLAETTKAKVAILDLHLQGGETAALLGLQPGPGLRIALEDPLRADTLFIERAAIEVNARVRLIAADEALDASLSITDAGVRHVLELLRRRFNFIVVDLPVPLTKAMQPVVAMSRHVLVLMEPEVTGLRNAIALRKVVTGIVGKNRVFSVLNRVNQPGGLTLSVITKALGGKPEMIIPDLGKGMVEAINSGVPAIKKIPALRRSLAPIVREIAGIKTEGNGWFSRWFRK